MNNIEKEKYLNQAISMFDIQERRSEAEYRAAFQKLGEELHRGGIKKFYKYRSDELWEKRDKQMLEEDLVWFSTMDEVNDIFEFPVNFDFNHMDIQVNSRIESLKTSYMSTKLNIGIFSMCEKVDNLLLWAHYGNSHHGYCVEYDALDVLECFQCSLLPVVYQEKFLDVSEFLKDTATASIELAFRSVITKGNEWNYENEWRCVTRWPDETVNKKVKFPKPTAIYLGCKVNGKFENKMIEFCRKKHMDLYKMKKSNEAFQIKPMKIEL